MDCVLRYIFKSYMHSGHMAQILKVATNTYYSVFCIFSKSHSLKLLNTGRTTPTVRPLCHVHSLFPLISARGGGVGGEVRLKIFNQSASLTHSGLFSVLNSNLSNPAIAFLK